MTSVLRGLRDRPRSLPSAYFYDAEGSNLFQRIMELPEYYLTRAEREILETHAAGIATSFSRHKLLVVDIGAGDGSKSATLLSALRGTCDELRYAAIDISRAALDELGESHCRRFPGVSFSAHLGDYASGLGAVRQALPDYQVLALFLGSNIGNLMQERATALLASWRRQLATGDFLLIGFDLVKDPRLLQAAYDDAEGVTAEFNLNLLRRLNREFGADFDVTSFVHHAYFAAREQRMESYLISRREQQVHIRDQTITFEAWEPIRTEVSYKYREADVAALASASGFCPVGSFHDSRRWFLDSLWRADTAPVR